MHLVKTLPADGRWRLVVFAGDIRNQISADQLEKLGQYLDSEQGPVRIFTPAAADIDIFIEPIVVLHGDRIELERSQISNYFKPITGPWKMQDPHKIFVDDESYNSGHGMAYKFYGVDPKQGAIVIVRPDQYVSMAISINDHEAIGNFFKGFASPQTWHVQSLLLSWKDHLEENYGNKYHWFIIYVIIGTLALSGYSLYRTFPVRVYYKSVPLQYREAQRVHTI